MKPTTLSSFLVSFMRVAGSTVVGKYSAVLVGGDGGVGGLDSDDEDTPGERMDDAEAYGAIGLVFRPRPPDSSGDLLAAEAMAVRVGGKLTPLAWRDLRINRKFPAPKAGTVALVGYGGGFLGFDDTPQGTSLATLYVPFAFTGDAAAKAHVFVLDPTTGNESISLLHAEGHGLVLGSDKNATMKNAAGDGYFQAGTSGNVINGNTVVNGGMTIGSPAGAVPLALAPAVVAYITSLETALAAAFGAITPPGGGPAVVTAFATHASAVATLSAAIASTKASAL